jgi:type IV pilus assembly protein PilW
MSTSASDITINQNNLNIKKNDLVVISDCSNADIFRVSDINNQMIIKHTQPENISLTLLKPYRTNAEITLFENITYYLKDTGRLNNSNNKIYTLYSIDSNNNEIELIDGVENLKIEYKIYQNNSFSYYTAKYIESNQLWDKIIAVKLNITFNSIDTLLKNGKPELIKKTITTIIYLRNK